MLIFAAWDQFTLDAILVVHMNRIAFAIKRNPLVWISQVGCGKVRHDIANLFTQFRVISYDLLPIFSRNQDIEIEIRIAIGLSRRERTRQVNAKNPLVLPKQVQNSRCYFFMCGKLRKN